MNVIKSLILGSAAAFVAMSGAQAADLPVKAKAVEYVKICSLYGAGFYYIPGTDTCLQLGGYMRVDTTFNPGGAQGGPAYSGDAGIGDRYHNYFDARARMQLDVDTRTATEYGVVRTFGQVDIQLSTLGGGAFAPATATTQTLAASPLLDTAGGGTVAPELLFLQFAGFTLGKSQSGFATPWSGFPGNSTSFLFGSEDTCCGTNNIQYTAQFGNGVSATIGLDDPSAFNRTAVYNLGGAASGAGAVVGATGTASNAYAGAHMPDIVGNVRVDQAWGLFQLSGAVHEVDGSYNVLGASAAPVAGTTALTDSMLSGHPDTKYGYAVMAALQIKNLPTGPGDDIKFEGTYTKGDVKQVISTTAASPSFLMLGSGPTGTLGSIAFGPTTDGVYTPVASGGDGSIHLTTAVGFTGAYNHNWDPHWASSLFGGYSKVSYDATATANYCTNFLVAAPNAGTYTCNPNYTVGLIGASTKWTPVKGLTFTAEAMYMRLGTGFSGTTGATYAPTAPLPTGVYQFKSQNTVELQLRAQRNF